MTKSQCGRTARLTIALMMTILIAPPGCKQKDPGFEIITLEGKIESIERESDGTGEIAVSYYSEKHNRDVLGTGMVTKKTEIMINGAVAKLSDLREGEHARGEVRVEGKGKDKKQTVLRILVERAKPIGGG